MKIHLITIGAPHLTFARDGFIEYTKRLGGFHKVHVTHLKESAKNTQEVLAMTKDVFAVALDEHGTEFTSKELAAFLDKKALMGISAIAFFIGGPDGHTSEVLSAVDLQWSLGKLTLPHDLAMLFTAEALYRASTINAGHPYHRG